MKNYKIFLDDVRNPYCIFKLTIIEIFEKNEDWVIVRDYYQFINAINKFGLPSYISFDHDLSFDHYLGENQKGDIDYASLKEKTGYHCAKWLVKYCLENDFTIPDYYVHSANPVGKENIEQCLENSKNVLSYE
jgi:hypothetical protein